MAPVPPNIISSSFNKNVASVNFYKSVKKNFIMKTFITEKDDKVIIKRDIMWFDSNENKYRKKREVQFYNCEDFFEENRDRDTYDNEFNVYNKCFGNTTLLNVTTNNIIYDP